VYGGFSYTEDLSQFVVTVLRLLAIDGVFYTVLQNVHLESGKDKPDPYYETELVDAGGQGVKVALG